MMRLQFAVTIADSDHWTPYQKLLYSSDQDKVEQALHDVMLKAGNDFVKANPDMFRVEVT